MLIILFPDRDIICHVYRFMGTGFRKLTGWMFITELMEHRERTEFIAYLGQAFTV